MIIEWFKSHEFIVWWISGASFITFIGTLIALPWLVKRIPDDYFSDRKRIRKLWAEHHPLIRAVFLIIKNLFGYIFILAGIIMLVLPGQGILTILLGIIFIDIPGKYRFERWIVKRPNILRSINWLRRRARQEPITLL
jgi:hypothetical protein